MTAAPRLSEGTSFSAFRRWMARHPVIAYLLIAFGWSWAFTPLVSISVLLGLFALFGPAIGAIVVSWADGSLGVLGDRITRWRAPASVWLAAAGIPFIVAALVLALDLVAGGRSSGFGAVSAIELVIFVLVIGEEIGWRGFLLPRLRSRLSLPAAGLATGVIWTLWHLPIYLAPGQGVGAFALFACWVVPLAIVMAFVVERGRFSVPVATVMHGCANVAPVVLLAAIDATWSRAATAAVFALIAISLIARSRNWSRQQRSTLPSLKEVQA